MPSPKAFLRDIADYNLDPNKSYTKSSLDNAGRVKVHRGATIVEKKAAEPAVEVKPEPKKVEHSEKKSTKAESPSTAKKPATTPSTGKAKPVETSVTATPEGTSSVENSVEDKQEAADKDNAEVGTPDNS